MDSDGQRKPGQTHRRNLIYTNNFISSNFRQMNPDKCIYSFPCIRKSLFSSQSLQANLYQDALVLVEKIKENKVVLNLSLQIRWLLQSCKGRHKEIVGMEVGDQIIYASQAHLEQVRKFLSGLVFFRQMNDFYIKMALLGEGAYATVYKVWDFRQDVELACKKIRLRREGKEDSYVRQTIDSEIVILKRLNHPNLIRLKEVYIDADFAYVILELVNGVTLYEYLRQHRNIPSSQLRPMIKQVLEALLYLSSINVIHRDLKLENIMVTNDGQIKILDFGLAQLSDDPRITYSKCGTPGYMAPEVANYNQSSQPYDHKCDLFSLGVILFKMITRYDLFAGTTSRQIMDLNRICRYHNALKLLDKYTQDDPYLRDLTKQLLHPDPKDRISVQEALNHPYFLNYSFIDDYESSIEEISSVDDSPEQIITSRRSVFRVQMQQ